jgi:hypothetical protein
VAELELAIPASGEQQKEVADQWWDLAEAATGDMVRAMRIRALEWYQKAAANLTGIAQRLAQKRLDEYPDLVAAIEEEAAADSGASITSGTTRSGGSSSRMSDDELFDYLAAQVKQRRLLKTKVFGFTLNKQEFLAVPDDGGLLVGFDVSLNPLGHVAALRPIFQTKKGQVNGPVFGQPTARSARVLAKRGYAVGAITVSKHVGLNGMNVTFMEVADGRLNPEKAYHSPWMGGGGPVSGTRLGGDGALIMGIFGNRDERSVMAIGLIGAERAR